MRRPFRILVVDDEPVNVDLVEALLKPEGYDVVKAHSGEEALFLIKREQPDLILLDLMMPGMTGYDVMRWLKKDRRYRLIPIIILTAYKEEKIKALEEGADDFVAKPIEKYELLARVRAHLRMREYLSELEYAENILYVLAKLIELRDSYTEEHTERVAKLSVLIGNEMGLDEFELNALRKGALLHDIGKIAVPDSILRKEGELTEEELEIMKTHVIIGYRICKNMESLKPSLPAILYHHERWDGKGYPEGLMKEEIPIFARIVAVADSFDAMTTKRPYRDAYPKEKALELLLEGAGNQWDPKIVDIVRDLILKGKF